jgi:hypothetical protein
MSYGQGQPQAVELHSEEEQMLEHWLRLSIQEAAANKSLDMPKVHLTRSSH